MSYQRAYLSHIAMLPDQEYRFNLDDAKRLLWKDFFEFVEPFDVKGTKFVVERAFANEDDQVNSYLPTQRRVRRLSAKERADSFMGTDFTLDDFAVFDRALTATEMKQVFQLRNGITSLGQTSQKRSKQE